MSNAIDVKPLEWVDGDPGYCSATKPFGAWYFVNPVEGGFRMVFGNSPVHPTIKAAKDAAQADYADKIRSALCPPQQD